VNDDDTENYYYEPRVSASWDGTRIAWASNFNYKNAGHPGTQYADIYAIRHKLTAAFSTPADGQTVSGPVSVKMNLTGSIAASWTWQFFVDGVLVSSGTKQRPATSATYSWNTTSVSNGQHTLKLKGTDADGVTASTTRTVIVSN
jgi:Big-like domain-containing protein